MAAIFRAQRLNGAAIYGPMTASAPGVVNLSGNAQGNAQASGSLALDMPLSGAATGVATATGQLSVLQPGGFVLGNPYVERIPGRSRVWNITQETIMSLEKRSWEERLYDFDMSALLAPDVTLASVSAMVAEPADGTTPITFGTPAISGQPITYTYATVPAGKVVQCRVSGGVERSYILRARCVDSNGEHVEGTVRLNVRDRP